MDHHLRILQQGIKPEAVERLWPRLDRKWGCCEVQQQKEEDLNCSKDSRGKGRKLDVNPMPSPQHEAVGAEQKRPEQ